MRAAQHTNGNDVTDWCTPPYVYRTNGMKRHLGPHRYSHGHVVRVLLSAAHVTDGDHTTTRLPPSASAQRRGG